jgi:short-subunit dehydrogenase
MHVVVTGASSGIGRALAIAFAKNGHRLSLVARREALLVELQKELKVESQAIPADLGQANHPVSWLERAERGFGPTDILINNAGTSYVEPVEGVDAERIRLLFQINVHTPIAAIHHVLPAMLARKSGVIVNVASNAAFSPAKNFCHYTATKGALGNFSESLRMEVKKRGVHVVSVYPGPIRTPMGARNWTLVKKNLGARIAPEGDPNVLARLVERAVRRRKARVIYPRFYALAWWLPSIGRITSEYLVPDATGEKTPPLEGDAPARSPIDAKSGS